MLAVKTAATCNVEGGAQCLSDEVAGLAMVGRLPVFGLVFDLRQRRRPANAPGQLDTLMCSKPCHRSLSAMLAQS